MQSGSAAKVTAIYPRCPLQGIPETTLKNHINSQGFIAQAISDPSTSGLLLELKVRHAAHKCMWRAAGGEKRAGESYFAGPTQESMRTMLNISKEVIANAVNGAISLTSFASRGIEDLRWAEKGGRACPPPCAIGSESGGVRIVEITS